MGTWLTFDKLGLFFERVLFFNIECHSKHISFSVLFATYLYHFSVSFTNISKHEQTFLFSTLKLNTSLQHLNFHNFLVLILLPSALYAHQEASLEGNVMQCNAANCRNDNVNEIWMHKLIKLNATTIYVLAFSIKHLKSPSFPFYIMYLYY